MGELVPPQKKRRGRIGPEGAEARAAPRIGLPIGGPAAMGSLWGAVDVVFVAFVDAQEVFAGFIGAAVGVDGEVVGAWGEFGFEPAVGSLEAFGAGGGLFEVQVEVGVSGAENEHAQAFGFGQGELVVVFGACFGDGVCAVVGVDDAVGAVSGVGGVGEGEAGDAPWV